MTPIISARGLSKRFGSFTAVDGLDFDIPAGHCFGFLGPNGAGKTTTLRMLLGRILISEGSLHVFGQSISEAASEVRARTGVVPQADNLDPDFSVAENLKVYASFFGVEKPTLSKRVPELLEFVGLESRADQRVPQLSGGMQRRLTLARALVNDPDLVVLDEPTTGLDPQVRHLMWQRLRDLVKQGKTLILTTHYMEEAERLCDHIFIIDHGRMVAQGSPATLVREHVEREVVELRDADENLRQAANQLPGYRRESIAESILFYGDDAEPLLQLLRERDCHGYLHRPCNLEDVFLRLTGRDLRE
ncbi:MAG: ATP-binding cassette domain-containing protein [Gammaproteobacteria bacterium]